jgi:DNA (cytosine-5)-methyltransferase 1
MKDIKVIELFAGVGGFRLGLEGFNNGKSSISGYKKNIRSKSKYKIVYSNQWEPSSKIQHASVVYEKRFGIKGHLNIDISSLSLKDLKTKCDMLVGGFPCQDYSVANSLRSSKGLLGKKGILWWQIERILSELGKNKPKFLILENVDRLIKSPVSKKGRDFAVMIASLNDLGYTVEWRIINAAEYGFPQRRRRVFIVGYLENTGIEKKRGRKTNIDWLESYGVLGSTFKCTKKIQPSEFILNGDLETISKKYGSSIGKSIFYNSGIAKNRNIFTCEVKPIEIKFDMTLGKVLQNANEVPSEFWIDLKDKPKWEEVKGAKKKERISKTGHVYTFSEGAMSLIDDLDLPSRTIITSEGGTSPSRVKHLIEQNGRLRRLTPIELEKLNMFPENFTNIGNISNAKRAFLMGNALVVGVVERIGQSILNMIK